MDLWHFSVSELHCEADSICTGKGGNKCCVWCGSCRVWELLGMCELRWAAALGGEKLLSLPKHWHCSTKVRPEPIQTFRVLFNHLNLEGELIKDVQSFISNFIINATVTQFFRWNLQWKWWKHAFQMRAQDKKQERSCLGKLIYLPSYYVLEKIFLACLRHVW